jgi:transcriptional antiterminator NusG
MPGYVLVQMNLNEDTWGLVRGTPGVTGFVGAGDEPIPLTQGEIDRLLKRGAPAGGAAAGQRTGEGGAGTTARPRVSQFTIGESVKVISGPLSDFSGEIAEINEDAAKLKVLVSIFGRETPVEVGFDQVKKV